MHIIALILGTSYEMEEIPMKNLGKRLSDARKSLNLTQLEVAEQLNVARTTVSNWEMGGSQT